MSTRTITLTFLGASTQNLPGGRFLFVKSATASLDITLREAGGTPNTLTGVGAGARYKLSREDAPWRFTDITSASAQTVVLILSDDAEFDIANTVNVAGSVTVQDSPSAAIADTAAVALPNAATTQIVAANPARRRVTITNPSTALASFFIRNGAGGANNLAEIQPGTDKEFVTTAALFGRNDSGGALSALVLEES